MPFDGADGYYDLFEITWVNYDITDWYKSTFLVLNDESLHNGEWECDSCTKHTFTLTSEIDQTVIVSASTW